ncbi:DUF6912 family protein [Nocardioides ferulae]|uniref:DUF6912 family protein n=1 Tax=Nocardioides ferulae TaxID=2340821 RepID=UPI0019802846|nr:hypothetical protein [Nocardioides ferulae]
MRVRVYVPVTSSTLATMVAERRLVGPLRAHAVTEALCEAWPEGDDEGWEYAALMAAAADSTRLRAEGDAPRRVVLAADVSGATPVGGEDDATLVEVAGDLLWKHLASGHLDTVDDAADDDDLAWYATQELADLV